MADFWSFLLQTLTASGVAVLVLAAKTMFRDKLSPRWQFGAWGLVGLALFVPAGLFGRYALINWPVFVEAVKSLLTGEYGTLTKVTVPVPLPFFRPREFFDWIYLIYAAGVFFFLIRYAVLYLRLRLVLRNVKREAEWKRAGSDKEKTDVQKMVDTVAEKYHLSSCQVLEAEGLSSAFLCGIFRPVLVLPAGGKTDEKIILHELLHRKYGDILWGLLINLLRCLHWCNPLMWLCADLAGNDLESLCDQRVLERLCGEERRDYGRILLAAASGNYTKMPGTSSITNGGKNIRRRIEAIARFKRYPAGMGLVSVCILLIFSASFFVGTKPTVTFGNSRLFFGQGAIEMARARTIRCTTYAGAFDTYSKAVLTGNILYLAMCAPLDEQNLLARAYRENWNMDRLDHLALPAPIDTESGYQIYNLAEKEENMWEGLLVLKVKDSSYKMNLEENGKFYFAVQHICATKQNDRFVVIPKEEFSIVQGNECTLVHPDLSQENSFPAKCYEASAKDFLFRMQWQTMCSVESRGIKQEGWGWSSFFDSTPKPDGVFSIYSGYELLAIYTGNPEDKSRYTQIGHSGYMIWDEEREQKIEKNYQSSASKSGLEKDFEAGRFLGEFWSSSSSDGSLRSNRPLEEGWGDEILLSGGGGNGEIPGFYPECYAMEFYLNNKLEGSYILEPVGEGGEDE